MHALKQHYKDARFSVFRAVKFRQDTGLLGRGAAVPNVS
jgi:hypothetical protein